MGDDTPQKPITDAAVGAALPPNETRDQRIKIFDRETITGQYCGFLDILGFSDATQNDLPAVLSKYEQLLDRADFLQSIGPKVRFSVYSDSFVLVSHELAPLISAAQSLQWFLLFEDCIVRGGIAYGDHAEGEKNGVRFIVSAGISKAVGIEKTIKWPCVAIHPDIEIPDEFWIQETRPLLYFDGIRMVSPFTLYWFQSASVRAQKLAKRYPDHAAKYDWFLRLYEAAKVDPLIPPYVFERLRAKYPELVVKGEEESENSGADIAPGLLLTARKVP
jgi:hypothetical protein